MPDQRLSLWTTIDLLTTRASLPSHQPHVEPSWGAPARPRRTVASAEPPTLAATTRGTIRARYFYSVIQKPSSFVTSSSHDLMHTPPSPPERPWRLTSGKSVLKSNESPPSISCHFCRGPIRCGWMITSCVGKSCTHEAQFLGQPLLPSTAKTADTLTWMCPCSSASRAITSRDATEYAQSRTGSVKHQNTAVRLSGILPRSFLVSPMPRRTPVVNGMPSSPACTSCSTRTCWKHKIASR